MEVYQMPHRTRDGIAICPFYQKSERNTITCDSVIDEARVNFVFPNTDKAEDHFVNFCATFCYQGCPYAQLLADMPDNL